MSDDLEMNVEVPSNRDLDVQARLLILEELAVFNMFCQSVSLMEMKNTKTPAGVEHALAIYANLFIQRLGNLEPSLADQTRPVLPELFARVRAELETHVSKHPKRGVVPRIAMIDRRGPEGETMQ